MYQGYFQDFKIRIQERFLIGLKHINLKEASDAFVSSLRKQTATVSKQSFQKIKKVLVDTDFVHLHNHTHSVLQSTSIPQLVKGLQKKNACSCHDRSCELDGCFSLCS
jgi:DNA polymerase-3 subunit alpha